MTNCSSFHSPTWRHGCSASPAQIFLNLQRVQAETTAGLLHTLASQISGRLREVHWPVPEVPALDAFAVEPFLTLDDVLQRAVRDLQSDQRIVLVLDEFEELERLVMGGRIDQRVFTFLRGVTQTGHGFVLVFAGLHTLEQMTRDYWHPFFLSVKPLKVTYFNEPDAWQLITDPIDEFPLQFDGQAIERIIAATRGQPYLVQDLCHNLVTHLNGPLHGSNRATLEDVNAVLDCTLQSGTYYFEDYVWGWSNPDEKVALAVIADAAAAPTPSSPTERQEERKEGGWVEFATVETQLGREAALTALKNLCARDILEERTMATRLEYRFQVQLSRLWVARNKPLARISMERGS